VADAARLASEADFTFRAGETLAEDLKVVGFSGTEGLNQLFEFRVELCSDDPNVAFDGVVGKACYLEIAGASGSRYAHGIVRRFERNGQGVHLTYYTAYLVPAHWILTKRSRCRIFQEHNCSDMTAPGIIRKVLEDAGLSDDNFRFATSATYAAREYVVQYRESEMDFIARLMEEEGLYYFFEHATDGHKMVIADGGAAHVASALCGECVFREPTGLSTDSEHFFAVDDAAEMQSGAARLTDFDFTRPATNLRSQKTAATETALEWGDFPGGFIDSAEGDRRAQVRLDEARCRARTVRFQGSVRALLPGEKFTLVDHPAEAANREYLVTAITHRATQPQGAQEEGGGDEGARHEVELRAIPADIVYRAPRVTPRPTVLGCQTALVVGPSGEEIYTDQYGRVKAQFHWDLEGVFDENSSCWIRVAQGMAGGQYGLLFLPRVGQEVIVDFLEGDPDRPLIVGRVYNADQMPPYTLPDEKTKSVIKTHSSTGGGGTNEICFEDLKDSEKILVYAQKDFHLRVMNDRVENVENDYHLSVTNNQNELIKKDHSVKVEGARKDNVVGDVSTDVGGKESKKVAGTLSVTCDSDVVHKFNANHKLEVTTTFQAKAQKIQLDAPGGIEIKCGGNSVILGPAGVALKAGGSSVVLTPATLFLKGPMTQINTAPGPPGTPVTPVTASATSPEAPAAPVDADEATPGQDTTYSKTAETLDAVAVESLTDEQEEREPVEPVETELTWLEIELVDEADQPVAGEKYEVILPDGKIRRGTLDANGFARIERLPAEGEAQVCFPELDSAAWERI